MSPEEIQAMAKGLAQGQAIWYLASAVTGGAITGLAAYLAEKGKNRATKEDIGEITRAVEETRKDFNRQLEDLKAHHQLRLVAAEKRIQAHQQAYAHWLELQKSIVFDDESWTTLREEGRTWYANNCMFLTSNSRRVFATAIAGFDRLRIGTRTHDLELQREAHQEIGGIFPTIFSDVDIPSLGFKPEDI